MQHRDEFDDPDIAGAMSSIFKAMDQRDRIQPRKPFWALALVIALVAFLGSVLWYSWPREVAHQELMAVPIIHADAGPIKEVPSDPGGMDIPHRDSTVFDTMRTADNSGVENLLSDREEPLPREQVFAGLKTDIKKADIKIEGRTVATYERKDKPVADAAVAAEAETVEEAVAAIYAEADVEAEAVAETAAAEQAAVTEEVVTAAANIPTPTSKPDMATSSAALNRTEPAAGIEQMAKSSAAAVQTGGNYYVQFASLKSDADARNAWSDLQGEFAVLKSLSLRVQQADLGARGTFYRVQAGPITEASARSICSQVEQKRSGGCLVIKP